MSQCFIPTTPSSQLPSRELSAFFRAVTDLYGPEQARVSAEDWLEESDLMDSHLPEVAVGVRDDCCLGSASGPGEGRKLKYLNSQKEDSNVRLYK